MNIFLMHWAIFLFMVGLVLSLPLGTIYYLKNAQLKQFITNPQKLKAAHLDFIMQAFSVGLVFLLEWGMAARLPIYAVIPLAFGTFCNPFIFLMEATPLYKVGLSSTLYKTLRALSPSALFFSWFVLAFQFLPLYVWMLLLAFGCLSVAAFVFHRMESKQPIKESAAPLKKSV